MNDKLTSTQKRVLEKMELGEWYSAYDLSDHWTTAKLSTLEALFDKKYVIARKDHGYLFYPRLRIMYCKVKNAE